MEIFTSFLKERYDDIGRLTFENIHCLWMQEISRQNKENRFFLQIKRYNF